MSTRFSKGKEDANSVPMGYEGTNIPDDFSLPSCTIEDVDRGLFNLFNEELPFFYKLEKESRRIPVIFATGERFAILRRKRPLRDNSGALILPLISIQRTGVQQENTKGGGPGEGQPLTIKKRLSRDDVTYQRLMNKLNLQNADDVASDGNMIKGRSITEASASNYDQAKVGALATRRMQPLPSTTTRLGQLLKPDLTRNIFEIITIPPTKFFTVSYNVTFWTQYTQQINDMLSVLMSAYIDMRRRTFRLETSSGYWFVAYINSQLTPGNNFDDFTDSERMVKYSLDIEVPAFLIAPNYPGAREPLRRFVATPELVFETVGVSQYAKFTGQPPQGPISGDPGDFILQNLDDTAAFFPGGSVAGPGIAASDSRNLVDGFSAYHNATVNVGGGIGGPPLVPAPSLLVNPFSGEKLSTPLRAQTVTSKGEIVYKDINDGVDYPNLHTLENITS